MAAVDTQASPASAKTACYRWYRRVASSRSAPGQILEIDLETSPATSPATFPESPLRSPGLYHYTATAPKRSRSKQIKRTKGRPHHHHSQVLMDSSILSSILDSPALMNNYNVTVNASGLQNMEAIKEHFRTPSSPLRFSSSCPCNIDCISSYQSPSKTKQKLIARQSRGSLESSSPSSSPDSSPEEGDSWSRTSSSIKSPKCSTPKASAPNILPLPNDLQMLPSDSNTQTGIDQSDPRVPPPDTTQRKKMSNPIIKDKSFSASLSPNSSHDESSETSTSSEGKNMIAGCKKSHVITKAAGAVRMQQEPPVTCRRNLLKEFEDNLTFKPTMNRNSVKIAARVLSKSKPLEQRLLETKRHSRRSVMERDYTFSPHLNPYSIKLARDRASRKTEV